jgi:hypothetical protein
MKIDYYKTIKDGELLKPFMMPMEPELTKIYHDLKSNSRKNTKAYLIKQKYNIHGIEKKLMDKLEADLRSSIGPILSDNKVELLRFENRIHTISDKLDHTFYIGIEAKIENPDSSGTLREKYSFDSGYNLEKVGIQSKKGDLFTLFQDRFLPIYEEKPKVEIKGEIYYGLNDIVDVMSIFHILNSHQYKYSYDTLDKSKIDKKIEEEIAKIFSFERNN